MLNNLLSFIFETLYRVGITLYSVAARLLALRQTKAKLFVQGRQEIWTTLAQKQLKKKTNRRPTLWVHAASLGEFDQARPVIEALKARDPLLWVVVSFFSPSGYTQRKNYPLADAVVYLPLDTPRNARKFLAAVQPDYIIFVKYEFWYFILREVFRQKIPIYLIAATFRPQQMFFAWYGRFFAALLPQFSLIFTQKTSDAELLAQHGIINTLVAGDPRIDRSLSVAQEARSLPIVASFAAKNPLLIAGSTWLPDEDLLIAAMPDLQKMDAKLRFVIVPHEINDAKIKALQKKLPYPSVRYTKVENGDFAALDTSDVLIIDTVGVLAVVYRYGRLAYIGGAFGGGLHNIIEAAVFGLPIAFGNKNYQKFLESGELINLSAAAAVGNATDLVQFYQKNYAPEPYVHLQNNINQYISANKNATERIVSKLP